MTYEKKDAFSILFCYEKKIDKTEKCIHNLDAKLCLINIILCMEKTVFILFGAPGSGKGYLGDCLQREIISRQITEKIKYVSTGDLLRSEVAAKTSLGEQISQIIASGALVPDEIVNNLVVKALNAEEDIFFLDGYPRTSAQLDILCSQFEKGGQYVVAIKRDTPIDLILERVSKRRICKECKSTHSVEDGCCPKCGGESVIRKDDAVIADRIAVYQNSTEELWDALSFVVDEMYVVEGDEDASLAAKEIIDDLF